MQMCTFINTRITLNSKGFLYNFGEHRDHWDLILINRQEFFAPILEPLDSELTQ